MSRVSALVHSLVAALWLAACSASGYPVADLAAEINATRALSAATAGLGDVIVVKFPHKDEWSHEVRVRADGKASFLVLGEVDVAGLTLAQLQARLAALYAESKDDNVKDMTVDIPTAGGAGGSTGTPGDGRAVYVVGEVENPGPQPSYGRVMTLFEAIAAAGGHKKETANLANTILIRRVEPDGAVRAWRLNADIYSWANQPSIYLQDRDVVFVPNTAIDDINIWIDQYIRKMVPIPFILPIR